MLLTFERLQYLVTITELGSFSAAARQLGVSASAVNQAVQSLELDLGVVLFERVAGKSPSLSDEGRALYFQALDIMPRHTAIEQKARSLQRGEETQLTIATHSMTLYPRFVDIIAQMLQRFPDVDLNLIDAETQGLALNSESFGADIMIAPAQLHPIRGTDHAVIDSIQWCFIVSPTHPLAALKGEITQQDLEHYPQLLTDEGQIATTELVESLRFSPKLIRYQSSYQLHDLLTLGVGFSLYPEQLAKPYLDLGLVKKLDVGRYDNAMVWPVEMTWRSGLGQAGSWFIEAILER
ncbi:LysR family transcriptional regulator [Vibrio methylphosphonaticus]|uniref:LysR family transcriptional regulator n=1 Tax=Vibrio methylphosphonaticus TaxID=2946866 RepID=UPI002029FCEB|nr:LysR family transcriptional regulator [Vibrio methylphosphonaticus]MCL9776927.1 LysR family transcriptional regulator [Vibrio methylphosphonaticus]